MAEAFVYCWSDMLTNKVYVGMHKGTTEDGYICSSTHMLKEYKIRAKDFVRQIIAKGTVIDCRKLENEILKKLIRSKDTCYNKVAGFFIPMTEDIKDKISCTKKANPTKYWLGKPRSEETKQKIAKSLRGVSRPHTEESKRKLSIAHTGKKQKSPSNETRQKLSEATRKSWENRRLNGGYIGGYKHSDEAKLKMSKSHLGKSYKTKLDKKEVM